jgi:putative cardiolipin synthase
MHRHVVGDAFTRCVRRSAERRRAHAFHGLEEQRGTALAAVVRPRVAAHPGLSGLHELPTGEGALAARLALADAAQRSLDVQYFIWNNDMVGKVCSSICFARRDRACACVCCSTISARCRRCRAPRHRQSSEHRAPHVQPGEPAFAPLARNGLDFGRINRRMHNKSFTADGQVAIVGGRNIGDEYFEANAMIILPISTWCSSGRW